MFYNNFALFFLSAANGTVYSWGGGSDGQLGHGEDVTYLSDPKPLPRSAFLGRISLIACGDSYSAAVMGKFIWICGT